MYSVEPKYAYQFDITWQAIRVKQNLKQSRDPSNFLESGRVSKA
jgi:hypothetical protein